MNIENIAFQNELSYQITEITDLKEYFEYQLIELIIAKRQHICI
jgi:hypothetical protein